MLRFDLEWQDAPGVRDPLLRETWSRLEAVASDAEGEACLTQCLDRKAGSLRRGVYGSTFPLARWVVENWWALVSEGLRSEGAPGGRAPASNPALREWLRRHNLLAARGGFALPDLTLFREGGFLALRSVPDPDDPASPYPIRFVADRGLRIPIDEAEVGLRNLVDAVAGRVADRAPDSGEARSFLADWDAIRTAAGPERRLCEAAAAMGLDPYDPAEVDEGLEALLDGPLAKVAAGLADELVRTTTPPSLALDLAWIEAAKAAVQAGPSRGLSPIAGSPPGSEPAHVAGYRAADRLRAALGVSDRLDDLETIMAECCGWDASPVVVPPRDGVASRIHGLVGFDPSGRRRLATPGLATSSASRRFLLARALFLSVSETSQDEGLLTRSTSWLQRASRAFAAELLAPADALARRVTEGLTDEQVGALAEEFQVSPVLIARQVENHRLAVLIDS